MKMTLGRLLTILRDPFMRYAVCIKLRSLTLLPSVTMQYLLEN